MLLGGGHRQHGNGAGGLTGFNQLGKVLGAEVSPESGRFDHGKRLFSAIFLINQIQLIRRLQPELT
jgi:hypothetical protein